ncbi:acyltransferase family protein [Streptomyces mobaraensis]|uniref:acyltransferase family protein n=1 Tax=Streptomyces mobaraensis TaxID=35621 RepID=UPI0033D39A7C
MSSPAPGTLDHGPAESRRTKAPRLYALDGLRLIAALMVAAFHLMAYNGPGWTYPVQIVFPDAHAVAYYGWTGVQLFFLISGFVICMSCWGKSVGEFAVSRVTRLYPAYWFAVIAAASALWLFPGVRDAPTLSGLAVNLTMFQDPLGVDRVDSVYWSLWAEMRFYLLFALVAWRGLTYRRLVAFCLGWATAGMLATKVDNGLFRAVVMPEHCWYFIAGIALYLIHRFKPNVLLWGIVAGCFLLGQHFLIAAHASNERYAGVKAPLWPATLLLAAAFLAMAAVAVGMTDRITWRRLPVLGALTYPFYLLHEDIGWIFIRHMEHRMNPYAVLAVLFSAALVASWLVHRWIERPLGRRLRRALNKGFEEMRFYSRPIPSLESLESRSPGDKVRGSGDTSLCREGS